MRVCCELRGYGEECRHSHTDGCIQRNLWAQQLCVLGGKTNLTWNPHKAPLIDAHYGEGLRDRRYMQGKGIRSAQNISGVSRDCLSPDVSTRANYF